MRRHVSQKPVTCPNQSLARTSHLPEPVTCPNQSLARTSHLPEQTAAIRRHRGMQWGGDCSVAADFPENPVEEMRVVCDWGEIIKHLRHVAIRP